MTIVGGTTRLLIGKVKSLSLPQTQTAKFLYSRSSDSLWDETSMEDELPGIRRILYVRRRNCVPTEELHRRLCLTIILTFTCVGIHPGRVEPAPPIALSTSRAEALQARRSCANLLDTFTQSFLRGRRLAVRRSVPGRP